jgi:hypothetical protein
MPATPDTATVDDVTIPVVRVPLEELIEWRTRNNLERVDVEMGADGWPILVYRQQKGYHNGDTDK